MTDYHVQIRRGIRKIGEAYLTEPEIMSYRSMGYTIKVI